MPTGIVEDEALGIHAWVMGQHPGQESGRVMRLQPRRLVGGQGEGCGVGFAEPERREGCQHVPDIFHGRKVVSLGQPGRIQPGSDLPLPLGAAQTAPDLVGLRQGTTRDHRDDPDDLLMEHHHSSCLGQHRTQVVVQIRSALPSVPGPKEWGDHVALDRTGSEQGDVDDQVVEGLGGELADQFPLTR